MQKYLLFFAFICLLAGCNDREKIVVYPNNENAQQREEVQQMLNDAKGIDQANVVLLNKELFVAIQLKPFEKWNKQKIEKQWQKKLQDKFSNQNVHVSTDFKLFWESSKLMEQQDQQKVLDELKHLKKLAKEET